MVTIASGNVDLDEELKHSGTHEVIPCPKASRPTVTIEGFDHRHQDLEQGLEAVAAIDRGASSMSLGIAQMRYA